MSLEPHYADNEIFSHLFRSNAPPSRSDELLLREKSKDIQASIESTKAQLRSLELQKEYLQIPFAPIRRIPRDSLVSIFQELQPTWPEDSFSLRSGPWRLARVCSSWRSIINDTPRFWSTIHVDTRWYPVLPKNFLQILCTIMQRTKSVELNINFTTRAIRRNRYIPSRVASEETEFNANSKHILDVLTTYSHRWRTFQAILPLDHWSCLRQIEGTLLKLETLGLDIVGDTEGFNANDRCTFFASAPKLQYAAIGLKTCVPPISLSLTATEVEVKVGPKVQDYLPEIIPSTALKLTLYYSELSLRPPLVNAPSAIPSFRNVKSLHAETNTLWYITLPNLEEIHLFNWDLGDIGAREVTDFLHRSSQALSAQCLPSKLTISLRRFLQPKLDILPSFSSIQSLTIDTSSLHWKDPIDKTMAYMLKGIILSDRLRVAPSLPYLTELTIHLLKYDCPSTRKLVHEAVVSRMQPPTWFIALPGRRELQKFLYTDAKHASITILTYDQLLSSV